MNVFVYGANLRGIHGAGAAKTAYEHHGAVWGKYGRQGASYGIPTKRTPWRRMEIDEVAMHVRDFLAHADAHPEDTFRCTPFGCGLAGFTPAQIAPMLAVRPSNVILPPEFLAVLGE